MKKAFLLRCAQTRRLVKQTPYRYKNRIESKIFRYFRNRIVCLFENRIVLAMSKKKPQKMSNGTRFTDCVPMPSAIDALATSVDRMSLRTIKADGCQLSYRRVVCPRTKSPKLSLQKCVLQNVCQRILADNLDITVIVAAETDCASLKRLADVYMRNLQIPAQHRAAKPAPLQETDEFRESRLSGTPKRLAVAKTKSKTIVVSTLAGFVENYMNTANYVVFVTHDEPQDIALLCFALDRCQTDLMYCVVELYVVSKIIERTYRTVFRKEAMFVTAGTVNYELIDLPITAQTRRDGAITCQLVALDDLPEVFDRVACHVCNTLSQTPITKPCSCGFLWQPELLAHVLTLAQFERATLRQKYVKNLAGINSTQHS